MDDLGTLLRFAHLLGVAVWLGGMLVVGAVVIPAVRAGADRVAARALVTRVARRFAAWGGAGWLLILVTGFGLLADRGIAPAELADGEYGRRVLAKLILLLAAGALVLAHAAWQGPRARRADEAGDAAAARRWRILGGVLDSLILLASLAALWLAASLVG